MNDFEQGGERRRIAVLALVLVLIGASIYAWHWKREYDALVETSLTTYNLTDQDLDVSVRYSLFPNPGQGAFERLGPHSGGGGLSCCVPIPTHWRPGIKMIVTYHFGPGPKDEIIDPSEPPKPPENQVVKIVELPGYPDGTPGDLTLVFFSETELELFSSIYHPKHPRWPGRRFVPVMEGVE